MQTTRRFIHIVGLAVAGLVGGAGVAQAQLVSADVGVNPTFEQTGGGVTSTGGFFSGRAFVTSGTDFSGGTLTYGGSGSPQTLSYVPADVAWEYGIGDSSFTDLQTAFPTGPYQFDLTGGTIGATAITVNYDGDAYSNIPQLTAASFAALQGVDAASPVTVDFNGMAPNPNANNSDIVFSISNASNVQVFSSGFLSSDTASFTIPGAILAAGQTYTFDLLYSDQIDGSVNGIGTTQFYDSHTDGSFSTAAGAVPEPSTWAMMLIGFAGIGYAGYRSARKTRLAATAA
jgi:hypothetical protein